MQKPIKSNMQNFSSTKKISLKNFLLLLDEDNFNTPEIRSEFFSLLKKKNSKIPIYKLIEIESNYGQKPDPFYNNYIKSIIETRIKELNEFVKRSLPDCEHITKETYYNWFDILPLDKCHQIIINSSINELARISKEIPPYISIFKTMTESLNSMIYDQSKQWLDKITKNETLTDRIFNSVQPEIENILFTFDTNYDFQPYIKRIIYNKFTDYCSEHAEQILNEPDSSSYHVQQSFITLCLILFIKLYSKPHHKLIFWHEFMYYVKGSDNPQEIKKIVEHDAFLNENKLRNLRTLWETVIDRIIHNCEDLIDSRDFFEDREKQDYSKYILNQFSPFMEKLEELFINVYTEKEYTYLRNRYPEEQVNLILLYDFFKDSNGVLLSNIKIRKLISNWNTRIKDQLVEVFMYQKRIGSYAIL
jgi:hypothetical protein